ncbi:hypothetical protein ACFE04_025554 [Oxalis oulophora]
MSCGIVGANSGLNQQFLCGVPFYFNATYFPPSVTTNSYYEHRIKAYDQFAMVGMMLRAKGFDNNTSIYLELLMRMFPLLYTKESIATPEELALFEKSLLGNAILKAFVVCESEPLMRMFSLIYTKEPIATPEELAPFEVGMMLRAMGFDYNTSHLFRALNEDVSPPLYRGSRNLLPPQKSLLRLRCLTCA